VGRVFAYEVTPSTNGVFQAGPVRLEVDGKVIVDPGCTVQVEGVESQDRVLVELIPTREAMLVDERFEVTLRVRVLRMQGVAANLEPLNPAEPPNLSAAFLEGEPIRGLDCPDMKALLEGKLINDPNGAGFALNNFSVGRGPFSEQAKFRLDVRAVEIGGRGYFEYSLPLRYVAREEGSYTFGPVVFKGMVVQGVDGSRRPFGRPLFAVGPACTVRVTPPPEAGRPECFIGAIGSNMTVKASLDTQTCNVGDPLTLTLEIGGDISRDNMYPLPLSQHPNLAQSFRVYEDAVQNVRKGDVRIFAYTVRPTRAGTMELPPVAVGYYNAARGVYEIVKSAPIPLRVNEAQEMGRDMIIQASTNRASSRTVELRTSMRSPAPMTMDPRGATRQDLVAWRRTGPLLAAGPAAWACVVAFGAARRRISAGAGGRRKRRAIAHAEALLAKAGGRNVDGREARQHVAAAIRLYLGEHFGASASSITPPDARRLLESDRRTDPVRAALCALFERTFNAAYGDMEAGDSPADRDVEDAMQLLSQLDGLLRAQAGRQEEGAE
jgi:hypothetical protein